MEPESSLPHSQMPVTCPFPQRTTEPAYLLHGAQYFLRS